MSADPSMANPGDDWLDGDGYPTESALERIRKWSWKDFRGLWLFLKSIWSYPDRAVERRVLPSEEWFLGDSNCYLSTGGWSGNEDVIGALRRNPLFWSFCWRASRAGGHYWFHIDQGEGE